MHTLIIGRFEHQCWIQKRAEAFNVLMLLIRVSSFVEAQLTLLLASLADVRADAGSGTLGYTTGNTEHTLCLARTLPKLTAVRAPARLMQCRI